ncbi:hypothetical protein [Nonomuraea basaltis]|uniref:hypothetical protein n=1 Tax=Nonomuraea basaltis TaxID=2495887 RepID=UPI00110C5B95|nr:hypothetical protein [Nonomuraea basaltis]TMR92259.1 hypothetical protein EJK15_45730 [Nonomuraea basaltis]
MFAERLEDLAKSSSRDLRAANKATRTIEIYNESIRFLCEWLGQQDPVVQDRMERSANRLPGV